MNYLVSFQKEIEEECENILDFWLANAVDTANGGFIGRMGNDGVVDSFAEKGLVLNARILWTFASRQSAKKRMECEVFMETSYTQLTDKFYDQMNGGYFWSLTNQNEPLNLRKQIYGQAFVLYALSAYYKYKKQDEILAKAIDLYHLIEKHALDKIYGGYTEAFAPDWEVLQDMRLSPKDINTPKSLNTHLHILEAYVQLYSIWKDKELVQKIKDLIDLFFSHMVDHKHGHVHMFFKDSWQTIPSAWSYGHDIETSWLLLEAAEIVQYRLDHVKEVAVLLARKVCQIVDENGGVAYETHLLQKHWWVQAEAMVGCMNAYQLTKKEEYISVVYKMWDYIKKYIKDPQGGEWFWGRNEDGTVMASEDKIGFWKCPYHNIRACIELSARINMLINQK
ncbi:MAG: AGE family epimerase/isomerase [Saprospiraceae bacterium]|nr:AGE family epimerase/isomerase [Saprospiraceae bacterium]